MEQWSVHSDAEKYVHYSQHPLGHYELEVKASLERQGTKMYKDYRLLT